MKKLYQKIFTANLKFDKDFIIHFFFYLLLPGSVYISLNVINELLYIEFLQSLDFILLGASLSFLYFIALFIVPLKAYQYIFVPPGSWEETIFFQNWIYIDILYLCILAFILAIFIKRIKLRYSWGIYIIVLIASRILMHVALHLFGYKAYYDFP